jgi:hypothetical protein
MNRRGDMGDNITKAIGAVGEAEVPTKSESTSIVFVVGVTNATAGPGIPTCGSMSYTVGYNPDPLDAGICSEPPESSSPRAVRSLKNRLRSKVADSAFLRENDGD